MIGEKTLFVSKTITEVHTKDKEGTGSLWWIGQNCYRYVAFAATSTQGNAVCHDLSTATTILGAVQVPATADLSMLAGIVCTDVATSATYTIMYGWVQVYGHCATALCTGTAALGSYMKGVNAASYLTVDAATQALYKRNAQILQAITTWTGTAAAVFVNCLD